TVSTTVSREADLAVSKSGPLSAKAGEYITYVLTVSNNGPSNGSSETLTDSLSGELQNATYCIDAASACNPAAALTRSCRLRPRSAKAGEYITYVLTVSTNGPSNGSSETLTDSLSGELQNATYCIDAASACNPAAAGALSWSGSLSTLGAINSGSSKLVRIRA